MNTPQSHHTCTKRKAYSIQRALRRIGCIAVPGNVNGVRCTRLIMPMVARIQPPLPSTGG